MPPKRKASSPALKPKSPTTKPRQPKLDDFLTPSKKQKSHHRTPSLSSKVEAPVPPETPNNDLYLNTPDSAELHLPPQSVWQRVSPPRKPEFEASKVKEKAHIQLELETKETGDYYCGLNKYHEGVQLSLDDIQDEIEDEIDTQMHSSKVRLILEDDEDDQLSTAERNVSLDLQLEEGDETSRQDESVAVVKNGSNFINDRVKALLSPSSLPSTLQQLRQFDLDMRYGPTIGMSRLDRWKRAEKMNLNPPIELLWVLSSTEGRKKKKIGECCFAEYKDLL